MHMFPVEMLSSKDDSVHETSIRILWYISLLYWGMLFKKIVQDGKILVDENTDCFIEAFDQI